MAKILFPMLDGGIVNYKDDMSSIPGCETCDYGSQYINDITIVLTGYKIHAILNKMYGYALSESDVMKLLLPAYEEIKGMTEKRFTEWFREKLNALMKERNLFSEPEKILREYSVVGLKGVQPND